MRCESEWGEMAIAEFNTTVLGWIKSGKWKTNEVASWAFGTKSVRKTIREYKTEMKNKIKITVVSEVRIAAESENFLENTNKLH